MCDMTHRLWPYHVLYSQVTDILRDSFLCDMCDMTDTLWTYHVLY